MIKSFPLALHEWHQIHHFLFAQNLQPLLLNLYLLPTPLLIYLSFAISIFLSLAFNGSQPSSSLAALHRSVLWADYGESAGNRSVKRNMTVNLFFSVDGKAHEVDSNSLSVPANDAFGTLLWHISNLVLDLDDSHDLPAIGTVVIWDNRTSRAYP